MEEGFCDFETRQCMDYNWTWKQFIMGAFSDENGPSSSRILTFILGIGCMGSLVWMFHHIMWLATERLILWLGALPTLIMALTAFFLAPYTVFRGSASISDIANAVLRKKDSQ